MTFRRTALAPRSERSPDELMQDFFEYRSTHDPKVRNRLVEAHLQLADYHSRRMSSIGPARDDLTQVAHLAILLAVERFDPSLGISFRTFASRTIEGECKRFLRDRTWTVRPPRSVQELSLLVRRVREELTHSSGRTPTVSELADAVEVSESAVREALAASEGRTGLALDDATRADGASLAIIDVLGRPERGYDYVDDRELARDLVARLSPRERRIIHLRFVQRLTETEIAADLGVSQSYLSRLLRRILDRMRREVMERGELARSS